MIREVSEGHVVAVVYTLRGFEKIMRFCNDTPKQMVG